ncbi:MAG: tRNA pseudouridine(38-40) synthase TruA [Thermodesulfobacteriota bacterium]
MKNIKLAIEYDGTNYVGWQRQPTGPTIQETIETSLKVITGEDIKLLGSGRTDSGVHALGQVAHFRTESRLSISEIQKGLNSILPKDIAIIETEEVDPGFHAQLSARSKTYIYKILNRPFPSAILRDRTWFIPFPLNALLMNEAARMLLGEHDFRAFTQSESTVKSTIRNVFSAGVETRKDILEFRIESDGFLKRMVRLIVGTLVQVGKEKITPEQFYGILESGEKTKFVHSAPARGLYLKEVRY